MKRLMVMTGRAGKALLEITAREIPAGEEGRPSYRWGQWR